MPLFVNWKNVLQPTSQAFGCWAARSRELRNLKAGRDQRAGHAGHRTTRGATAMIGPQYLGTTAPVV